MTVLELGKNGPKVARIGQGTFGLGGFHGRSVADDATAIRVLECGLSYGFNLIDTAENYGAGHTEELVGRAVQGKRQQAVISTKFDARNSGRAAVLASADASLRRLNTDYIDIYQPHWPNPSVPIEETVQALDILLQSGKIRWVGLSNFGARAASGVIDSFGSDVVVCLQHEYNLLERSAEDRLLPLCERRNLVFQAYSPLAAGRLLVCNDANFALFGLARQLGVSVAQLALAWILRQPRAMAIPKTHSEDNLRANAQALELLIPEEELRSMSEALKQTTILIDTSEIDVSAGDGQRNYASLQEAKDNTLGLSPSPIEMAKAIATEGALDKPIKLRYCSSSGRYTLLEGRLKYWAWLLAFGEGTPIPALVEQ